MQVYFPESLGTRLISFKYQMDVLRYGSILRLGISIPSFSQVYLRGGAPVARHFNLIECDAGHALNALFNILGSEKVGAPKPRTHTKNNYDKSL